MSYGWKILDLFLMGVGLIISIIHKEITCIAIFSAGIIILVMYVIWCFGDAINEANKQLKYVEDKLEEYRNECNNNFSIIADILSKNQEYQEDQPVLGERVN